jgi:hypothetical protein
MCFTVALVSVGIWEVLKWSFWFCGGGDNSSLSPPIRIKVVCLEAPNPGHSIDVPLVPIFGSRKFKQLKYHNLRSDGACAETRGILMSELKSSFRTLLGGLCVKNLP